MNLPEVKQLFAYNAWASNRIFEALAPLSAEEYFRDLKSSHGGIHGTLTHMVAAEKIWLSRWIGKPETTLLKAEEIKSLAELKSLWEDVGRRTAKFLLTVTEKRLDEAVTIKTTGGKEYTHTYRQMLQHLVNHSTYHRGQIVALLRQLGAPAVSTDLIVFYRQAGR